MSPASSFYRSFYFFLKLIVVHFHFYLDQSKDAIYFKKSRVRQIASFLPVNGGFISVKNYDPPIFWKSFEQLSEPGFGCIKGLREVNQEDKRNCLAQEVNNNSGVSFCYKNILNQI
jgi:hypothetical protein